MFRSIQICLVFVVVSPGLIAQAQPLDADPLEGSAIRESGNRFQPNQYPEWVTLLEQLNGLFNVNLAEIDTGKFAVPFDLDPELVQKYNVLSKLPPIESFFFPLPETVCFPDDRKQVLDTTVTPWSANCELVITMQGGQQAVGTGWLLGPRLVVTAGHCVHEGAGGDFFESVEVIPGMNGPVRPFGSQTSGGSKLRASNAWKTSGPIALDYGAILLDAPFQTASGASPGHHAIAVRTDAELSGIRVYLSGYPADKAFGSQWTDEDPLTAVQTARLKYMLDTFGGHSGSAVIPAGESAAVGIHNYGGCPNHCTRITDSVKADLDAWLSESSGP